MTARQPFPRNVREFHAMFPDERACFEYVVASRWPGGSFSCPKCGNGDAYKRKGSLVLECTKCRALTSATAGTAMHRSKMPLSAWLLTAWLLVTDKRGISSVQLADQLSTRQETAYMMLQKLRAAMVAPDRTLLAGVVEVDESFITTIPDKPLVAGAVEVRGDGRKTWLGRIRLRRIHSREAEELLRFVIENVDESSTIVTDAHASYGDLPLAGYRRKVESTARGLPQSDVLRHYHLAISNLKTYLAGTYHGAVGAKHIQAYLNEYAFRFNRRNNLPAAFQRLLGIASEVEGPEYDEIYAAETSAEAWVHPNPKRIEERIPLLAAHNRRRGR